VHEVSIVDFARGFERSLLFTCKQPALSYSFHSRSSPVQKCRAPNAVQCVECHWKFLPGVKEKLEAHAALAFFCGLVALVRRLLTTYSQIHSKNSMSLSCLNPLTRKMSWGVRPALIAFSLGKLQSHRFGSYNIEEKNLKNQIRAVIHFRVAM